MVRPVGPRSWTCTSCGWKHITAGGSDVLVPWVDVVPYCPECGGEDFETKQIRGFVAPLISTYARFFQTASKARK